MPWIDEPLVCPIVIGRSEQLSSLQRLMAEAESGKGHVALLAGEAGIGKSRLASQARELAAARDWHILQGHFFETDRTLPFGGLIDLVRAYVAARPGASLPDGIARLAPELAPAHEAESSAGEATGEKRRLFHAFASFLSAAASQRPALVVLEDLHWADDASLEFLLYLSRQVASQPIVLLLTYRSNEVNTSLAHLLAGLERERLVSELHLPRLSIFEVDRMLRAILKRQRSVRPEILHAIHDLTDGNPFFVEEVVRSLSGTAATAEMWDTARTVSAQIPRSVEESVQQRRAELNTDALRVLEIAAVAGRRFDFSLLLQLSGLDEAGLLAAVKQLIAVQLVAEESLDQFAFRHALTRQAVYAGLLLRERRRLHERIGQTLASVYAGSLEDHCEDLAYHAFEAEDWQPALTYSRLAGERALALYSPGAAVEHFSRALAAAEHLAGVDCADLRRGRGKAYETLGDFDAALRDYEAVLESAQNGREQWQATLDLGMLWAGRDYERTGEYFARAATLAEQLGDPVMVAHSLNRAGNWLVNVERPAEGIERHLQALSIFRELNDRQGLASTLDLLAMSHLLAADLRRSTDYYRQAIALFEELNDRLGLASSLGTLPIRASVYHSSATVAVDALPIAAEEGFRAEGLAREIGWRSGESYAQWNLALCLGPQGRYGEALDYAASALEIANEIEHRQWQTVSQCALGLVQLDIFDLAAARVHLEASTGLAQQTNSRLWARMTAASLAQLYVATGELERAALLLAPLRASPPRTLAQREVSASWVDLQIALGQFDAALAELDDLAGDASNQEPIARLLRARARALLGLGRETEAETLLLQTVELCVAQGRRSLLWRLHADLAGLYLKQGKATPASTQAAAARALIEALATTIGESTLRAQFVDCALQAVPGPRARASGEPSPGGLTQREREVAVLVAQGLSNRAMADELVLSERTVESHVANALSKLGFSSRAQLAAWVVENRLVSPA